MKLRSFSVKIFTIAMAMGSLWSCKTKEAAKDIIQDNVDNAVAQLTLQTDIIEKSGKFLNPRTYENGKMNYVPIDDWCSGFFPGTLWYTYKLTGDKKWETLAAKYTEQLDSVKHLKWHHDVGFMIGSSYLNGLLLDGKEEYKPVIIEAAKSLSTRFRKGAGIIQSWNVDKGTWQAERGWTCPVIIDNMMNLELLFEATRLSGDSTYYNIAVSHANTTLKNHFRKDNSCYHVIDYNPETGEVLHKHTAQGYAHETAWARGQVWALYGYTMCYRYTKDERYLEQAQKVYDFIFNHPNLPKDLVPYWDYNAPKIPNEPRDASAAACTASALYELATYVPNKGYKETADKIIESLSSPAYRAKVGTNGNFILMHSVGSIPHGHEIDTPLNYADYYFMEALLRKQRTEKVEPVR